LRLGPRSASLYIAFWLQLDNTSSAGTSAAWIVLIVLRRIANHFGLLRRVWRPAWFVLAVYTIVLSSIVLIVAHEAN